MKTTIRHNFLLGAMVFIALFSLIPSRAFAVAGTVYFSKPTSDSILTNAEFTLDVYGNVPGPDTWPWYGGGATIFVSYDASKLKVVSYNDTGGVFAGGSRNWDKTAAGTVRYESYVAFNAPGVSNKKIISVKFQALVAGNTTVSFGSGTNVNNGPTTGTPSTVTILAPTCPAGQIGTPPNCTTPVTPSPSPTPRPTTTTPKPTPKPATVSTPIPEPTYEEVPTPTVNSDGGLKIEDVKVSINRQESRITWSINNAGTVPTFKYGTSKTKQLSDGEITKKEDGSYEVILKDLKPGTLFYFTIKTATEDNLQGANYSGTLTTRGYPVQLTVQQNNLLLPGAKIRINERTFVANKDAIVTTELSDGEHTAQITPAGSSESYPVKFTVAKKMIPASGDPELQRYLLNISTTGGGASGAGNPILWSIIGAIGLGTATIGGIAGFFIMRKRQSSDDQSNQIDSDMLAASYGQPVEALYQNMPAPNLDTRGAASSGGIFQEQPLQQQAIAGSIPPQEAPVGYSLDQSPASMMDPAMATPVDGSLNQMPTPLPSNAAYYEPTSLPLPPTNDLQSGAIADTPASYTEEEQLSTELVQVESGPSIQPDALYDETTGELDILHHSSHAEAEATQNAESADESPNELNIQHAQSDKADSSLDPLPQESLEVAH